MTETARASAYFLTEMFALVFIGALFYFLAVDKRGEAPAHEAAPAAQSQPDSARGGNNASTGRAVDGEAPSPPATPAR